MIVLVDFAGTITRHKEAVMKAMREYNYPFWRSRGFKGTAEELYQIFKEVDRWAVKRIEAGNPPFPGEYEIKVAEKLGLEITREEAIQREFGFQIFYAENVQLVEGAVEGIKQLSKLAPLFVFSHADTPRVVMTLQRYNLLKYFAGIIPLTEMGLRKPTGSAFEFVVKKFGEGHVMIGDKEKSDGVCENYGIKFVNVKELGWKRVVEEVRRILGR